MKRFGCCDKLNRTYNYISNGNDCICTVKCAWEGRGVILRPHLNLEFFPLSCGVLFTMGGGGGGGDGGVAV